MGKKRSKKEMYKDITVEKINKAIDELFYSKDRANEVKMYIWGEESLKLFHEAMLKDFKNKNK